MSIDKIFKKYNLPKSVKVSVKVTQEGYFFAELPDFPGCITEARNFLELIKNVTDAILTYFEVPITEAEKINLVYLPPSVLNKKEEPIDRLIKSQENKQEHKNTAVMFNYFISSKHGFYSSLRG